MTTIFVPKEPNNLSHSRVSTFMYCPWLAGVGNHMFEKVELPHIPSWQAGGKAGHDRIQALLQRTLKQRVLLPQEEVDDVVGGAVAYISAVLAARVPIDGFDPKNLKEIYWLPFEEKQRKEARGEYAQYVRSKIREYIGGSGDKGGIKYAIRAIADRCTKQEALERFEWMETELSFPSDFHLVSPRDRKKKMPVMGFIDVLEKVRGDGLVITDWKSGNFDHFVKKELIGNRQMLLYWAAVKEMFGAYPSAAFFVSLSVPYWAYERYGAAVLEQDRYRKQAIIDFPNQWDELVREFDDVWAVWSFVAHMQDPVKEKEERATREAWEPGSKLGKEVNLKLNVLQGRFRPICGSGCAICTANRWCRDHPANKKDWEIYESKQSLGNVVNPIIPIPSEWLDPSPPLEILPLKVADEEKAPDPQFEMFSKPVRKSNPPIKGQLKPKDLEAFAAKPEGILALLRLMMKNLPIPPSIVCPCMQLDMIPLFLIQGVREFHFEREAWKRAQVLDGKKRSGKDLSRKDKVKELYDSDTVRELCDRNAVLNIYPKCKVQNCPLIPQCWAGIDIESAEQGDSEES